MAKCPRKIIDGKEYRLFGTRIFRSSAYYNRAMLEHDGYHTVVEYGYGNYKIWCISKRNWDNYPLVVQK